MPLSLLRLFAAVLASVMSTHVSASCHNASASMANSGARVIAGLREAVSQGPMADPARSGDETAGSRPSIDLAAGASDDDHSAFVMGVVTRGKFILEEDGKPPRVLGLGETFFEAADTPGLRLASASPNASARMVGVTVPRLLGRHPRREHG